VTWLDCEENSVKIFATVFPKRLLCRRGKNRDFQPISRFISETIPDVVIVTTEDERQLTHAVHNGVNSNEAGKCYAMNIMY